MSSKVSFPRAAWECSYRRAASRTAGAVQRHSHASAWERVKP